MVSNKSDWNKNQNAFLWTNKNIYRTESQKIFNYYRKCNVQDAMMETGKYKAEGDIVLHLGSLKSTLPLTKSFENKRRL